MSLLELSMWAGIFLFLWLAIFSFFKQFGGR